MISKMVNDKIILNQVEYSWKKSVKYLGVILDNKLTFKNHIDHVVRKASNVAFSTLYCLLSRKSKVPVDTKIRIFKSYIRPILTYACPVFSNAAKCHLSKLQLFQNKLLRMILNIKWDDFRTTLSLHDQASIPCISDFINKLTTNFYQRLNNHPNDLFSVLGQYKQDSLNFRVKHKLPKAFSINST
jgi:hypothetical protein